MVGAFVRVGADEPQRKFALGVVVAYSDGFLIVVDNSDQAAVDKVGFRRFRYFVVIDPGVSISLWTERF